MSNMSSASEFQMLRVQLEPLLPKPAIVLMSSARAGDGKHLAARGLAASFEAVGARTLLVDSDAAGPKIAGAIGPKHLGEIDGFGLRRFAYKPFQGSPDYLTLVGDKLCRAASLDSVAALCASLRSQYSYTVVDATTLLDNNLVFLLATASDGILLTVRDGRRITAKDRELVVTLDRASAKLLGVISVSSTTIRADSAETALRRTTYGRSRSPSDQAETGLEQPERQPA